MKVFLFTNAKSLALASGISVGADVAMNSKQINGSAHLMASGTIASDTAPTNALMTSGVGITTNSDLVLPRGLNNSLDMDAHPG